MVAYLVIFYSNYLVLRNEKLVNKCENSWTRSMYSYLFIASCRHFVACVLTMLTSLIRVMKVGTFFMPFVPTSISLLWYCCGSTAALSVHSTKIRYTTIVRRDIYRRYYNIGVVPKYSLLARPLLTPYVNASKHGANQTRLRFRCDLTFEIMFLTIWPRKLKLGMHHPRIFKIRMVAFYRFSQSLQWPRKVICNLERS